MQIADINVAFLFILGLTSMGVYGVIWGAGLRAISTVCVGRCVLRHR